MKPVIIIAIAVVLLIPLSVFAQESLISVQTDDSHYDEGDIIVVSGNVTTIIGNTPVTFQLFIEGSLVDIVQVTVTQDGSYSHTIIAEGQLWKKIGNYLIRVSYGEGNIAETEFSFSPKSESIETTTIFEVNAGNYGTFDVEYTIKGGTIKNMIIDSNIFAIIVQIESTDRGTVSLDLPREFIGAEKQDGKDDTFIILIDGIEVAYQESVVRSDSRVIIINFEEGDSDIEIIGTYVVGAGVPRSTSYPIASEVLDNPYASITTESIFRIVPEKPNVGSSIRVTGDQFGASQQFDFYIDSVKVGSFVTDNNGFFLTSMKIPDNQKADRVDFIVTDSQGNEKLISLRIGEVETRIPESSNISLTAEIRLFSPEIITPVDPIILVSTDLSSYKHGDIVSISGNIENFVDHSIVLDIVDPEDIRIWDEQVLIKDNGDFSTLVIAGDNWVVNRNYVLTATYYDFYAKSFFSFQTQSKEIPSWIKNNAAWWSQGEIDDDTFVSGIQYLMKEKIVNIPNLPPQASEKARPSFVDESKDPQSYVDRYNNEASYKEWFDENYPDYTIEEAVGVTVTIPGWIKNTASWWSEGLISEDEFVKAIEFLVEKKILRVS